MEALVAVFLLCLLGMSSCAGWIVADQKGGGLLQRTGWWLVGFLGWWAAVIVFVVLPQEFLLS